MSCSLAPNQHVVNTDVSKGTCLYQCQTSTPFLFSDDATCLAKCVFFVLLVVRGGDSWKALLRVDCECSCGIWMVRARMLAFDFPKTISSAGIGVT